jgi:YbbR domain-containing protein
MQEQIRASLNRTNLLRLGASLVLALILWGWVSTIEDPKRDRTFADLTVTTEHLAEGLIVTTDIPNVRVEIDGPESDVNRVVATSVLPYIDLSDITEAGQYTVDIDLRDLDGLWHTRITPSKLTLTVENQTSKDFPLETEISGDSGSSLTIGQVRTVTTTVTVTGAESDVAKVARVVLPITIENQTRDFVNSFTPVARDANGNSVTDVTITPTSVSATVPISGRGKTVTVIPQTAGEPADGYSVTNKVANPQTVRVDGPEDVIAGMIAVSAGPVDVQGATTTIQSIVPIYDLPDGVTVIEPSDGNVAVQVNIVADGVRQELAGQSVTHVNLGEGLGVEIQPSEITVIVNGTDEALSALAAGDITVRVDLDGLGPGTYSLKPEVSLVQGLTWISSDPSEITVTIVSVSGSSATPDPSAPAGSPAAPTEAVLTETTAITTPTSTP